MEDVELYTHFLNRLFEILKKWIFGRIFHLKRSWVWKKATSYPQIQHNMEIIAIAGGENKS
jgi:hypothetical protein